MAESFQKRIQRSLENADLQAALDGNADRRLAARQQAYASLPEEMETLRQRAHAIRVHTIANLDAIQAEFITNARVNGIIVHQAADAAQAVEIILKIASQNKARLIAKSKTMLGEEINLNHALEAAGIKVVETDLGEYIVQLRGERPAHIITPAVHLRRGDVAQTFTEKLGVPYNEDIPAMTALARETLRQVFLQADIGISGVNFGVAESGTLCLLTNEGNGRMVTTIPRLHIALMGIERIVPTLQDLSVMLALLPRSATGQKLTVYTNLIHGPRRPPELDGPDQRHLILIDNGRSALIGSPLEEALYCIRCGACLNACPVFREIGGHAYVGIHGQPTAYPGPIGAVLSPGLYGPAEFGNLARASSLCGACKEACPVDIDLPRLLLRVRAGATANPTQKAATLSTSANSSRSIPQSGYTAPNAPVILRIGLSMYTWTARSPKRFAAAQRLAGWFGQMIGRSSAWLQLPGFTGWGASRDFPAPAQTTFSHRFAQLKKGPETHPGPPQAIPAAPSLSEISPQVEPHLDTLDRFEKELQAIGGVSARCQPAELSKHILALLAERKITRIQTWEIDHLPVGLLKNLQSAGIRMTPYPDPEIKAGLTGALAGIADTGTVVLPSGVGQPLTVSLLPELHITVLDSSQIYENLNQVFDQQKPVRQAILDAPAAVLISGPSRTADIEMTLTIGVHGPREIHVFCLT